jgi:tetratricopeptide (TPR) repeat protein
MRRFVVPLLFLAVMAASPVLADSAGSGAGAMETPARPPAELRADRLDELFARLHRAKSLDAAQGAEHDIWTLWMTSDSPTADALLAQATRAMNDGAYDASRAILDKMVTFYPKYSEVWNKRATLNYLEGRLDESLADIDHVLTLEPRHFGALSGKGLVLEKQKKFSEALTAFHDALDINPNMSSIQDEIGKIEKLQRAI